MVLEVRKTDVTTLALKFVHGSWAMVVKAVLLLFKNRDLRTFIDEQNSILIEKEKEARKMVLTAKGKEKQTKQQMQNEIGKAIASGKPLSITKHDELVSKMKKEAEDAHTEILQAMEKIPKTKQRSDAVRTDSLLFDGKGHVFLEIKKSLEELNLDTVPAKDKWFPYDDVEEKGMVYRFISSREKRRYPSHYTFLVKKKLNAIFFIDFWNVYKTIGV